MNAVHTFANGVSVYETQLLPAQLERYAVTNVHEPEEESIFVRAVQRLPEGAVMVSIGAAIGYYLILALKLRPDLRVFAYEPLKRHRDFLKENLSLNGIEGSAVQLYGEAVSAQAGQHDFEEMDFSSRLRVPERAPAPAGTTAQVSAVTLSDVVVRCGGQIDFLQMDVQGHEMHLLRPAEPSLADGGIRQLLIGTHGAKIHSIVRTVLLEKGYQLLQDIPEPSQQPDGVLHVQKQQLF